MSWTCKHGHTDDYRIGKDGYKRCCECRRIRRRRHYQNNKEEYMERNKLAYAKNPGAVNERSRRNQLKRMNRQPAWVDNEELKKVYMNCPAGKEVDHIVPVTGRIVSGLHVPWNLQYLTPEENKRKHNQFPYSYKERIDYPVCDKAA